MCKEYITIAICAPQKAPSMSFTCGQLHLVAESRQVCEKAAGACLCFVGTCGVIQNVPSTEGILISSVKSIRCASCTSREEEVGERRTNEELIGSPLLTRTAVKSPEEMQKFKAIIKNLWNGGKQCPYHALLTVREQSDSAPVVNKHASDMDKDEDSIDEPPVVSPREEIADGNVSDGSNHSNVSKESKRKDNNSLGRKVGIEASIWANEKEKPPGRTERTSPPRFQTPAKRQKQETHQGRKISRVVLPQIAAARLFLEKTNNWD